MFGPKARNVTGAFVPFMLSAFAVFSISMVVGPLSSYFGVSISDVLLSVPIDFIGGSIGAILLGHLSDRIGRKPVMMISSTLFSAGLIGASFMGNIYELYLIWFVIGVGVNSQNGVSYPLLVETLRRSTGFIGGIMQGLYWIGFLVDSIFYFLFPYWRYYFLAAGIFSIVLSVATASLISEPERPGRAARGGGRISGKMAYYTLAFSLVTIGAFMFSVPLMSVVPTLLATMQMPETYIFVFSIIGFLGFVVAGYASDKISRWKTTVYFASSGIVLGALLGFIRSPAYVLAVLALMYISSGFFSFTGIWTSENYPVSIRATATNIVFSAARLLGGFSPVILVLIGQGSLMVGLSMVAVISAILAVLGSILFVLASRAS